MIGQQRLWTAFQIRAMDDGKIDDRFGRALAVSGDYIVIGAPNHDENGKQSGAA